MKTINPFAEEDKRKLRDKFIRWALDEGYRISYWPSTSLEVLKNEFEEQSNLSLEIEQIWNALHFNGVIISDELKAYIYKKNACTKV